MKRVYWRPKGIPVTALILLCALSVGGIFAVEKFQKRVRRPYYHEKIEAARLALKAMEVLKEERLKKGLKIDPAADPAQSGLIGSVMTETTTGTGDLEAKQTSVNANFAAVVVELLKGVKVKEGDPVAVSFTGSFPALNVSVCAAIQTLKLKPVIISAASASQWGANESDFLWIDMEQLLYEKKIFSFRSVAASIGGKSDQGEEISQRGRELLNRAIVKNGLIPIRSANIYENVDHRVSIYYKDSFPKVFIHVGGGVDSVGRPADGKLLKSGVVISRRGAAESADSAMHRFLEKGIPVIHLENITRIASAYRLPLHPSRMQPIGEGEIYSRRGYDRWLAGLILLMIIIVLYIFSQSDLGFRIFKSTSHHEEPGSPEPMI